MKGRTLHTAGSVLACIAFWLGAQAVAQAPGSQPQAAALQGPAAAESASPEAAAPDGTALNFADAERAQTTVRPNATVQQPRAFGYVVGDLLTQRVLLNLNGREFVPAELPSPGRIGVWFERRAARVEEDASGRRWLSVDYQLMNSPQALRVVTLPAWKLRSTDGAPRGASDTALGDASTPLSSRASSDGLGSGSDGLGSGSNDASSGASSRGSGVVGVAGELRIAEWPISVGPLTSERADARPGLGSLQPDRNVPLIALAPIERGLGIGIAGIILTALAWVAWLVWRNWRTSAAQPFARAMLEMREIDGAAPEAWHALHRAFDATAGRAMRVETLPDLFRRAPQLVPLRAQIEEFFRESAARFFAGAPGGRDLSPQALCRDLRRIEKRHER